MPEAASAETADRMTAGASALLPLPMSWWMRLMSSGSGISLVAKCRTTGEAAAHRAEIFDIEVSRVTISNITERVLKGLVEWQSRPWTGYPVIFVDVINIKIRDGNTANWPVYTTPSPSPATATATASAMYSACGPRSTAMGRSQILAAGPHRDHA
jgi:Transposase, Mutator family